MLSLYKRNCSLMLERCCMEFLPVCGCSSVSGSSTEPSERPNMLPKQGKQKRREVDHKEALIDPQEVKCDCIGPADRHSNLRITQFYIPPSETPLQRQYREARTETQGWNQSFWSDHNANFKRMKEEFIQVRLKEKYGDNIKERKTLSADDMSEFYKRFLDDNKDLHKQYNREWYKKNANNVLLAARVWFQQRVNTRR
ncbi:cytochrome c oxidase assembly factor 8-like [Homarus americanus]|uniref:Cytochrome c oxidase assembly factor 8-like n=1 Tax=Homarus americanus TaxID=6706 RepID=A0A8J5K272_HOMAM|nr:cytochrome c oxidase assembly factor 8-like [Homarus americanus]KAG7168237.1 Cytochrome c oxidase assembly factor 8-like [Homarus americanus]